jgi:hypothetical protein
MVIFQSTLLLKSQKNLTVSLLVKLGVEFEIINGLEIEKSPYRF